MANKNSLNIRHSSEVAEEAKKVIDEGRTGEQLALYSRHEKVKRALLGGWRFNNNYIIAGASGHSKSYYLNMLYQDFVDEQLNKEFKKPFKILHFAFEMTAYDEVIRSASGIVKSSYRDLLSVDGILPDSIYQDTIKFLERFKGYEIYYCESSGNCNQIEQTILDFQARFPQHLLVVGIDHMLLTEFLNESNEVELISNTSRMMLRVRKLIGNMGLQVSQLNADIEENDRISNPSFHYPKKKDLHGSKALYQAADYCIVIHQPEKLGIRRYGTVKMSDESFGYPTENLIAWHLIKARKGVPGLIRLKNELQVGNITEWTEKDDRKYGI
jgi:hypothetical protein